MHVQCIKFDFNLTKILRLAKNNKELEDIKNVLSINYKYFNDAYKYYSGLSPVGDVWCI